MTSVSAAAAAANIPPACGSDPGRASPVEGVFFVVPLDCARSWSSFDKTVFVFVTAASATIIASSDAVAPSVQSGPIKSPVVGWRCADVAISVREARGRARG